MLCAIRKQARNALVVFSVEFRMLLDIVLANRGRKLHNDGDRIAIVGGELFNKGAQAMTFILVDQMAKWYPEKDVYLLSGRDYERNQDEIDQYSFNILPWGPEVQFSLISSGLDILNTKSYSKRVREDVRSVFNNCCMLIDINGFALSSQWGAKGSFVYLTNIVIAKEYDIPMYIFPQSIGPFDYSKSMELLINPLLNVYLSYPRIICPREKAGVEAIEPFTQDNVQQEYDIVLQTENYSLENVYVSKLSINREYIKSDAVGIVPNSQVFKRSEEEEIYTLYGRVVTELLDAGKNVYIFRHSSEDLRHCRSIKNQFSDKQEVKLFEEDFDAPELEYIINQCDFLIASRYHSIVHAYKNGVPVVAIGWAVKYEELLAEFGQSDYLYEGREKIDTDAFVSSVAQMIEQCEIESESIREKLKTISRKDMFSRILDN